MLVSAVHFDWRLLPAQGQGGEAEEKVTLATSAYTLVLGGYVDRQRLTSSEALLASGRLAGWQLGMDTHTGGGNAIAAILSRDVFIVGWAAPVDATNPVERLWVGAVEESRPRAVIDLPRVILTPSLQPTSGSGALLADTGTGSVWRVTVDGCAP